MSGSPAPDNHPPAAGREQVLAAFARKRAPVQRQSARDEALATWSSCYRAKAAAVSRADHPSHGDQDVGSSIAAAFLGRSATQQLGGRQLIPDSCRVRRMPTTAELGPEQTKMSLALRATAVGGLPVE